MEPVTFRPGDLAFFVEDGHARKCEVISQNTDYSVNISIDNDPSFRCVLPSDLTPIKNRRTPAPYTGPRGDTTLISINLHSRTRHGFTMTAHGYPIQGIRFMDFALPDDDDAKMNYHGHVTFYKHYEDPTTRPHYAHDHDNQVAILQSAGLKVSYSGDETFYQSDSPESVFSMSKEDFLEHAAKDSK